MSGICILCKEPITNPISIENMGKHIETWLPDGYARDFRRFNLALTDHIRKFYTPPSYEQEQIICVHCYVKEVYQWLKRRSPPLAEKFISVFYFGYKKQSFNEEDRPEPVHQIQAKERDFGICDECGEYSETLNCDNGEWVCEGCI
jgi:hypothetical protein